MNKKEERIVTIILSIIIILIWITMGGIYLYTQRLESKNVIEQQIDKNNNVSPKG